MRWCSPAVLLAVAVTAAAGPPSLGVVTADGVAVRAAPRADAPDTGTLPRGTAVVVHHPEGDAWLAVQPPPGSMSWINHLFVQADPAKGFPQNGTVNSDGAVKLAAGKVGVNRPLDVRKAQIPDGTIVVLIGPPVKAEADGSTWYPIQPPADDFRYLPKDAVQLQGPAKDGFVVKSPPPSDVPAVLAGHTEPKPGGWTNPNHPLWVQAEQAEQANQLDRAEELYFKLAKEMNAAGGDPDLANLCYTRIHALREKRRQAQGVGGGVPWTAAADKTPPRRDEPVFRRDDRPRVAEPAAEPKGQWSGAGVLRPAFKSGGRQLYALEDGRGRVIVYAVPANGVDLARHRGRTVDLFGTLSNPDGLNGTGLMTVGRVDSIR